MSKRTKLKLRNMQMFMTKYIFNSKFIVRNLLALTVLVTIVAAIAGVIVLIDVKVEDDTLPEVESVAVIYTYEAEKINTESFSRIKTSMEDQKETVVEANETQMVAETTGEFDTRFIAINSDVNIRKEPSTDSEIVGTLDKGDIGDIISSEGEWLQIKSGDVTGYVKVEFVLTGSAAEMYAADYQTSKGVVTETGVYIRQEASVESDIIGTANEGDSYKINTTTTDTLDGWVCIYLEDGNVGYICSDYVKIETGYSYATPVTVDTVSMSNDDDTQDEEETAVEESESQEVTTEETSSEETTEETTEEATEETTDNQVEVDVTTRSAVTLSDEDINLMAAVIYLESGSESYDGQLAVANVIINRLLSGAYGSTIYDVVYAPYQFTVVNSDQMATVLEEGAPSSCVTAATEAAGGKNNVGSYMCFKPSWNVDTSSLSSYTIIGNHVFY